MGLNFRFLYCSVVFLMIKFICQSYIILEGDFMKAIKKAAKAVGSRAGAFIFFAFSALAFTFFYSSNWAYGWISELYPLGEGFITLMLCITGICAGLSLIMLLIHAFGENQINSKAVKIYTIIHSISAVLSIITFIYTFILLFGIDQGFSAAGFSKGFNSLLPNIGYLGAALAAALAVAVVQTPKKAAKTVVACVVIAALTISPTALSGIGGSASSDDLPPVTLQSEDLMDGAQIVYESLKQGEKADAENLLADNGKCWTAQDPDRMPANAEADINNSYVEIQLDGRQTFNTAIIEEVGNEAQYFRLQALINGEWETVYQSEKIQTQRLCSFDAVTTDRIRLSIDKFRDSNTPVKIRSIKLFNEPQRAPENFEVTAYQRLDGDVPTEILARGDEYVANYARFYDVYSTIIVFGAVHWDENGNMGFGDGGEEQFAREIEALKEIISRRSNPEHEVKLVITALADGTWGEGHNGVNGYMAQYWEPIADKIAAFAAKYDFDGVDIDWEYPQTASDWDNYDKFIAHLDDELQKANPDAILTAALSAGSLGMSKETLDRLDQIQFMAYDGSDEDGYQSSLQQAQEGLQAFIDNGADISKINIGIAAYGRPVNGTPYWATWRDLDEANYWDNKYYTVHDADQVYEGTFCSPALAGDKTAYALFTGCGGVMVFRVACDKTMDDPNSVACGIENALNRYFINW